MENLKETFHFSTEWTGCLLHGTWLANGPRFRVLDKYRGTEITQVSAATAADVTRAADIAAAALERGAPAPAERAAILRRAAALLTERRQSFTDAMVAEAGFTTPDAAGEIDRAIITLHLTAEECTRLVGDMVPFAACPGAHQRLGYTVRHPIGIVCAITPFNSPLNTVLHKVAPAFGAGNPVILKPSALTPLTAALLATVLLDAGMPADFLALLQGEGDTVGTWLLAEPRIAFYTFTGSTRVGRIIQQAAGLRRTQMELGSIASTIVCADADLGRAIPKIANAAFRKAGQVCTSVQRLYVERPILETVAQHLAQAAAAFPAGDPRDPATRVGPLITESAARRAEQWIADAVAAGARRLCGGERQGSVVQPTVLLDAPAQTNAWCQEAFAPLVSLQPFDRFEDAIAGANSTPYGLSAGVFTANLERAFQATRTLRFGTVQINETSSARSDVMPFGGVKDSGFGKEGPWHAMREMTEERLVIFNP
ncbi:succinate-semialdehyde dehydrogenase [Alicycliphilus denitrificans]|uniref:aldehyde dehydrogenase family protein n=1 Tax=Alicycliphilus denitrificans TaxID=179636 RepID=UPI000963AE76|nr:aldehyde dehydrogenase family protein [Alicycliphilus denitrificans]OJW85385.1 MAG: aldehyde dehydrogenase [Alicycliphilus sp. 69-12]BCN36698.1 succinate-semialdehyde dehydrogenase [Alicycliphilus denitrificans]